MTEVHFALKQLKKLELLDMRGKLLTDAAWWDALTHASNQTVCLFVDNFIDIEFPARLGRDLPECFLYFIDCPCRLEFACNYIFPFFLVNLLTSHTHIRRPWTTRREKSGKFSQGCGQTSDRIRFIWLVSQDHCKHYTCAPPALTLLFMCLNQEIRSPTLRQSD